MLRCASVISKFSIYSYELSTGTVQGCFVGAGTVDEIEYVYMHLYTMIYCIYMFKLPISRMYLPS